MHPLLKLLLRIKTWIAILLIYSISLFGQHEAGPFDFSPYVGNLIWQDQEQSTINYKQISMNQLPQLADGEDGIIISFNVHLRPSGDESTPLIAFSADGTNNNLLEIIYSKNTVTLRRYGIINSSRKYYDYHLFDPLFQFTTEKTFEFRVYFTTNFLYLVTKDITINAGYLMSPIYFGLDYINKYPSRDSNMYKFLNRDSRAVMKIGDYSRQHLPYVSDAQVYGFIYQQWANEMQSGFSSPNPPTSSSF